MISKEKIGFIVSGDPEKNYDDFWKKGCDQYEILRHFSFGLKTAISITISLTNILFRYFIIFMID